MPPSLTPTGTSSAMAFSISFVRASQGSMLFRIWLSNFGIFPSSVLSSIGTLSIVLRIAAMSLALAEPWMLLARSRSKSRTSSRYSRISDFSIRSLKRCSTVSNLDSISLGPINGFPSQLRSVRLPIGVRVLSISWNRVPTFPPSLIFPNNSKLRSVTESSIMKSFSS